MVSRRSPSRMLALVLWLGAAACTPAAPMSAAAPVEIAMCPEPWRLEDCGYRAGEGPSCAFIPVSAGSTGGQPRAWAHDAQGQKVVDFALPLVPGGAQAPRRVRLALEHTARPVHRIVVCSVDPLLPVVRERITPVVQRTGTLSNP